jgi:predicted transposase/invertase (TIGR01784 family)
MTNWHTRVYDKKEGRAEGRKEGRKEGRAEGILEAARAFKRSGISPEVIAQVLGLTIDDVLRL